MAETSNGILQRVLKGVLAIVFVGLALLALLVAWWIALILIAAWLIYAGVRRVLQGDRKKRQGRPSQQAETSATIIEGEFRVESNPDASGQRPGKETGVPPS